MKERFYAIQINAETTGETVGWVNLSETEFTKKEADRELRRLRTLNSPYKFRKCFLYEAEVEAATVRNAPPIVVYSD